MNTSQPSVLEKISHLEEVIESIDTVRLITKPKPYSKRYDPIKSRIDYEKNKESYKKNTKNYYKLNKEYYKTYRENNKERRQLYDLKYNAKRKMARIVKKLNNHA